MNDSNGELESTLIGIILAVGSVWFLWAGVIPWHPAAGAVFIGLYLMLPRRMRTITDSIKFFIRNGKK